MARLVIIFTFLVLSSSLFALEKKDSASLTNLSVDFQNADIHEVLTHLAEMADLNIVIHPSVNGKVTLRLKEVSWRQVFTQILRLKELRSTQERNIIIIYPLTVNQERDRVKAQQ